MAYKTAQQIISKVERMLYQSAGSAVQIYSQDLLLDMLQDAFDHLFDEEFWPQFRVRQTLTLDGVTGRPTVAPADITSWEDIQFVLPRSYNRPLRILPDKLNTDFIADAGVPRYIEHVDDAKLFRVWPLASTGTVQVVGRKRPNPFIITDTVKFDSLCIEHYMAWSYFTDDESSPGSAQKHQGLFEKRLQEVRDSAFSQSIQLNDREETIPNTWTEWPS